MEYKNRKDSYGGGLKTIDLYQIKEGLDINFFIIFFILKLLDEIKWHQIPPYNDWLLPGLEK